MKRIIVFLSLLTCVIYGEGTALGEGEGDPPLFAMPATELTPTFTPSGTFVTSPNFVVVDLKPPATAQPCDTNPQCDDGNDCTDDKCSQGSCVHSPIAGCGTAPNPGPTDEPAPPEPPPTPEAPVPEVPVAKEPVSTEPKGEPMGPDPVNPPMKMRYAICLYGDNEAFWADTGERFLLSDACEPLPTRTQLVKPEAYALFQSAAEYERDPKPERLARLRETLTNIMVNDTQPPGQEPYTVKSLSVPPAAGTNEEEALATTASIDLVRFKEHVAQKRDLVISIDGTLQPMNQEDLTALLPTGGQVESLVIGIDAAVATGGGGSCALIPPHKTTLPPMVEENDLTTPENGDLITGTEDETTNQDNWQVQQSAYTAMKGSMPEGASPAFIPVTNQWNAQLRQLNDAVIEQKVFWDCVGDVDADGVPDCRDNCAHTKNPDQLDTDGDGLGDECDNCVGVENVVQDDWNHDGLGDACQDSDGDGTDDILDNCVQAPNPGQEDRDDDETRDACDPDPDEAGGVS